MEHQHPFAWATSRPRNSTFSLTAPHPVLSAKQHTPYCDSLNNSLIYEYCNTCARDHNELLRRGQRWRSSSPVAHTVRLHSSPLSPRSRNTDANTRAQHSAPYSHLTKKSPCNVNAAATSPERLRRDGNGYVALQRILTENLPGANLCQVHTLLRSINTIFPQAMACSGLSHLRPASRHRTAAGCQTADGKWWPKSTDAQSTERSAATAAATRAAVRARWTASV